MLDKLKHCCQNISSTISWKAASHKVPDSSNIHTKTEDSAVSLNHNLKLDSRHSGRAFRHMPRHCWEASDMWVAALTPSQILSASIYLRLWRGAPSEETSVPSHGSQGSSRSCETSRSGAHKKGITDEYHLAKSQFNKRLKHRVPAQDLRGESVCHQWLRLKIVLQIYHSPTLANDI